MIEKNNRVIFHTIKVKKSTIKNFIIIDLITGTGIYWIAKFIFSSSIIALISSAVGAEGVKKIVSPFRKTT
ncbi:hypothetical protein [Bacillus manliponensis]|uniref:hypothetical protein n=1 Tax=Bacillus manliponensis TaxID=574376 RepID=UPI0012FC593B|nr:hypothetical protein [Bacillus manliponensis]